jgi:hypothetical protein
MLLTDQERRKFIEWCRQEIETNKILIEQAGKLTAVEMIIRRLQVMTTALVVVAQMLENVESQTISRDG